jgi:hypothetical protein
MSLQEVEAELAKVVNTILRDVANKLQSATEAIVDIDLIATSIEQKVANCSDGVKANVKAGLDICEEARQKLIAYRNTEN